MWTLLAFAAWAAPLPPGAWIDPAVSLDVTPTGFDAVEDIARGLVPTSVEVPDFYQADSDEQCIDLIFVRECWNWYEYEISTAGLGVQVALTQFDISPGEGRLRLDVAVELAVASSATPGSIYAYGEVIDLISVEEDCDVWLDPTPITASTAIDAELVGGAVDFTIRPFDIQLDLSRLNIRGCVFEDILELVDVINDIVGFFGFDIYEIIADAAEPVVEQQLNALLPDLELALEGAFSALNIETEVPIGDAVLHVAVAPSALEIVPEGMRLSMGASVAGGRRPDPCISKYASQGSRSTPGEAPPIGGDADRYFHHIGVFADDDLVNQALYTVWYEGLMCFTLDPSSTSSLDLPIELDTKLIGLLADGALDELFPTAQPLVIETRPTKPPIATIGTPHQINAVVDGLGVDMYAELDGRLTRVVGLDVAAEAGIDLWFDDIVGELGVNVAFATEDIGFGVVYNELAPSASAPLEAGLGGLVDTIVGPLLGGLTEGLTFPIPAFSGLGLTGMGLGAAGSTGDHLGMYATIGSVAYTNDSEEGGCTSGCESGCTTSGGSAVLPGFMAGALLLRRRSTRSR